MAGSDVGNHRGDEEGAVARSVGFVLSIFAGFFLKRVKATDARGKDHAHLIVLDALIVQVRVENGLLGGCQCVLCVQIGAAHFFHLGAVVRIEHRHSVVEILDLARELCLEQRCVEVGDGAGTTLAIESGLPSGLHIIAQWGDSSHSRNHYSLEFHIKEVIRVLKSLNLKNGSSFSSVPTLEVVGAELAKGEPKKNVV